MSRHSLFGHFACTASIIIACVAHFVESKEDHGSRATGLLRAGAGTPTSDDDATKASPVAALSASSLTTVVCAAAGLLAIVGTVAFLCVKKRVVREDTYKGTAHTQKDPAAAAAAGAGAGTGADGPVRKLPSKKQAFKRFVSRVGRCMHACTCMHACMAGASRFVNR